MADPLAAVLKAADDGGWVGYNTLAHAVRAAGYMAPEEVALILENEEAKAQERIAAVLDAEEALIARRGRGRQDSFKRLRAALLGTCSTCGQVRDHDRTSPCSNPFHTLATTEEGS